MPGQPGWRGVAVLSWRRADLASRAATPAASCLRSRTPAHPLPGQGRSPVGRKQGGGKGEGAGSRVRCRAVEFSRWSRGVSAGGWAAALPCRHEACRAAAGRSLPCGQPAMRPASQPKRRSAATCRQTARYLPSASHPVNVPHMLVQQRGLRLLGGIPAAAEQKAWEGRGAVRHVGREMRDHLPPTLLHPPSPGDDRIPRARPQLALIRGQRQGVHARAVLHQQECTQEVVGYQGWVVGRFSQGCWLARHACGLLMSTCRGLWPQGVGTGQLNSPLRPGCAERGRTPGGCCRAAPRRRWRT